MPTDIQKSFNSLNGLFKAVYSSKINSLIYGGHSMRIFNWESEGYPSEEIYNLHKQSMNYLKDIMGIK